MNDMQMKPLSVKELSYISDCIDNEDMLIKMCAAANAVCTNPQFEQVITEHMQVHEQHMHKLLDALKQHQYLAPSQVQ